MSRLNDETAFLLQRQVDNVDQQNHQLTKPGVLHPLYSIFPSISCISQYLSMEDLIVFRMANRTINEASEKAFLYWLSLKILRGLSKITNQENVPLSIRPRYLNPSVEKTIHFPVELTRFIAESLNREKIAEQLFLQCARKPTAESMTMQKHFIQLCRDIGDDAPEPEGETRLNCNYLLNKGPCFYFVLLWSLGLFVSSIVALVCASSNERGCRAPVGVKWALGGISAFMMSVGLFCAIRTISTSREAPAITDQYGSQLVLNSYSARMFKRIADSANIVAMPVDWMSILSKTSEAVSQLKL